MRSAPTGRLARFSAQLVSITPATASFFTSVKPRSCQNEATTDHTCSAGFATLIQRWLSSFSILNSPSATGATLTGAAVRTVVPPAGVALALITPRCCGWD